MQGTPSGSGISICVPPSKCTTTALHLREKMAAEALLTPLPAIALQRKDDDEEKRKSDAKRASEARSAATASMDSDKVSANTSVLDKIRAADAERESNRREAQRERGSSGADDGNGEKLGGQIVRSHPFHAQSCDSLRAH